jgi:mannitol/fructose-specific phosphotransferase system IIA component (Ntr-type)
MSEIARSISQEEIVELQEKFSEIKRTINNVLAVMMALSEMSQRRPELSEKLASTVLTKAPLIVSRLQEFTQALNEKAGPKIEAELQKKFSEIKYAINNALAVMMALSEMSQRRPDYFEKLASTVLKKAPQIVSGLQEFTQALNEKAGLKPEAVPPNRESRMSLASLFPAEQIIPEMKATEGWSAIVELMDLLVSLGKIKAGDRESILASLKQREEEMSTGGFGIAIPHASSDRIEEVVAAFGRSSHGIEFDAFDNAPVKFVVLFIAPKNQIQNHLRTLASIAKLLNDRSVRESLATAKSADEIFAIFRDRSQK